MPIIPSSISRREFLRRASSAAVAAPFVLRSRYRLFAESSEEYPERVVRLIREELVIDMLNQFLYRKDKEKLLNDWLTKPGAFKQTDFEFFMNSGVNAINLGDGATSLDDAEKLFAKWDSFLLDYPQWLARINSADDFEKIKSQGQYGIIFGLQSSLQFENLDAVNACYGCGQRISQLSYNFRSLVADGAFEPHDAGVSEYGQQVIERMNEVGMAVDLGHASDRTKLDACEMSTAPVILSHGNCRALNPDAPRTSTDEAIRKLAKKGGVMGITCIAFMVKGTEPVTIEDVVDHFDHVRDLVGIEHVGLGSDAGVESNDLGDPKILEEMLTKADPRYHVHGTHEVVAGLEGQKRVYDLTAAFVRRGYTDEQLRLVLGQNWRRVLGEIWHA
ncbi:MAG TPA: membrane dipeptidase [Terriglobales bacterium]|nr:membrane dipeptidase [Terriglobales bacterium]